LEAAGRVTIKVETDLMEIGEAETAAMGIVEDRGKVATGLKVVIKAAIEQAAVTREEADPEVDIKVVPTQVVSGQVVVIKVVTGKEEDTPVGIGQAVPGKEATDQMAIVPVEATREVIVREAINKESDIKGEIMIETDILQEIPAMINQEVMVKAAAITKDI
jgi:hypothetical protein